MKALLCLWAGLAVVSGFLSIAVAQEVSNGDATNAMAASSSPVADAPPLAPGVADIAKMAQARVGDSIILAYINNSGTVYSLDPAQIIYLRDVGASEAVISAMLEQRQKYVEQPANPPAQTPVYSSASATDYAQPETTYVQSGPAAAPVSTVYVIPYSNGGYYRNYGCYGYYPSYSYFPSYYTRYPACYNGFGYYGFRPGGYSVGYRYSTPNHFVAGGGYHSMGGHFHGHR